MVGFDYLMQAETGWFSVTGELGSPPARFGLSVVNCDGPLPWLPGFRHRVRPSHGTGPRY